MKRSSASLRRLTVTAMFCALAYVAVLVIHISGIGGFLTFDVKDAILASAAMIFGPVTGLIGALAVSLLEMVTVSGTGPLGALMNFVSSAAFACIASLFYHYAPKLRRTLRGALCGLALSVIGMTAVMMVMNLLITPIYTKMSREAVAGLILPLLLPFNLIKATLNAALVMILHRPLTLILTRSRMIEAKEAEPAAEPTGQRKPGRVTPIVWAAGLVIVAVCVVLLITVLGGQFQWKK